MNLPEYDRQRRSPFPDQFPWLREPDGGFPTGYLLDENMNISIQLRAI
jgi:hypothetical protein